MNPEKSTTEKQLTREQQQLVNNHVKKAKAIANTYCTPFIGEGDLHGAAYLGLCHAAMNYDETREASFATFMNKYVTGEILHTIRLIRGREEFSVEDYADYPADAADPNPIIEPSEEPSPEFERKDLVGKLLERLTPRERMIIENLYGLNGNKEHTVAQIAAMLDLSSTHTYKTIKTIMQKLKNISKQL